MIYLVTPNHQRAYEWGIDEGVDASDKTEVYIATRIDQAYGRLPSVGDRVILLPGGPREAYNYLREGLDRAEAAAKAS